MKSNTYPNGESVTRERIQDEPWYGDYQGMMEMACFGEYVDFKELLQEFEWDFSLMYSRNPTQKEHERFERWAKCEYAKKETANA